MRYFLAILPSFISIWLRRLLGAKIGRKTKIKFGTILYGKEIEIGENVKIGPFVYIHADKIQIGDCSEINYLVVIRCNALKIGKYSNIAPYCFIKGEFKKNSSFSMGDHSLVSSLCWFDPGEGIEIGNRVGIGGNTLIFTHGNWSDFLNGGPRSLGPIKIEDNVWLPWRTFILPNVHIGKDSIIQANSLVNESIPANVLASGTPAKVIKENILGNLNPKQKLKRAQIIGFDFSNYLQREYGEAYRKVEIVFDTLDVQTNEEGEEKILFLVNMSTEMEVIKLILNRGISILDYPNKLFYIVQEKKKLALLFKYFISSYGIKPDLEFFESK